MSFKITPILLLVLLFGIGLQKAWGINAEVTYYHNDLLGSPVAATDEAGEVIWREDYNPFGEKREAPLENANDVGFTGHQSDDDVGLTYMRARYYDPLVGRFYGVDPVGFTGGIDTFNRYAYVANNPFKYLDPTGMSKEGSKRTVRDLKKQEQKCSEGWRCYSSGHQSRYDQGGNAQKSSPLPPVSALVGAGSTGADLAASMLYCISGGGSCLGSKTFKALQSDPTWVSNTAPMRLVAKAAFYTSIGIEAYEFNQARNNSDGLGMLDAVIDSGAMLPALVGGAYGAAFSAGYAIGDNLLGPLVVPPIVNGACSLTGNC